MSPLKKIMQTKTGPEEGNCLQACIATITGIPIDDMPDCPDDDCPDDDWIDDFNQSLKENYGIVLFSMKLDSGEFPDVPVIASGESPNYPGKLHAVVYKGGKLYHDPSPTGKGLKGKPESYFIIMPSGDRDLFFNPTEDIKFENRLKPAEEKQ